MAAAPRREKKGGGGGAATELLVVVAHPSGRRQQPAVNDLPRRHRPAAPPPSFHSSSSSPPHPPCRASSPCHHCHIIMTVSSPASSSQTANPSSLDIPQPAHPTASPLKHHAAPTGKAGRTCCCCEAIATRPNLFDPHPQPLAVVAVTQGGGSACPLLVNSCCQPPRAPSHPAPQPQYGSGSHCHGLLSRRRRHRRPGGRRGRPRLRRSGSRPDANRPVLRPLRENPM